MSSVEAYMNKKIAAGKNNGCTLEKAGVRREWYVHNPNGPVADPGFTDISTGVT